MTNLTQDQIISLVNEVLVRGSEGKIKGKPGFEVLELDERKIQIVANRKQVFLGSFINWGAYVVAAKGMKDERHDD